MAQLNEYLGSIVSSITNARVMSDIQSVKVAEEYAKHNLLQHFSIPRMRIQDVELTIPIALENAQEKTETVIEPFDQPKFAASAYTEVVNSLGLTKISATVARNLKAEIAAKTTTLQESLRTGKDIAAVETFASDLLHTAVRMHFQRTYEELVANANQAQSAPQRQSVAPPAGFVASTGPTELPPNFTMTNAKVAVAKKLGTQFKVVSQTKALGTLDFIVEASKMRDQKPENIIYIKMKISEEGMEWHRSEDGKGGIEKTLQPE